jgi:hypothetical protein
VSSRIAPPPLGCTPPARPPPSGTPAAPCTQFFYIIDRHLALIFYYFFLYTVFVCKFRPQESQSDVLGDLRRMISLVVELYFDMPPLLLPGLEPASPGSRLC